MKMASSTYSSAHLFLPPISSSHTKNSSYVPNPIPLVLGSWRLFWAKDIGLRRDKRLRCNAALESRGQGVAANSYACGNDEIERAHKFEISVSDLINEHVATVKSMFDSMGDGRINASAYDTAWVTLVKDVNGRGGPQFPSSLQWIVDNQLPDGSWGDAGVFNTYDRLLNTLACVVALKSWNIRPDKCSKGLKFVRENISKLEKENAEASEQMLTGFELVFFALVEIARDLDIQIPLDSPVIEDLMARKKLKFKKIPKDLIHSVPTSLLYSLEGLGELELDWEKLLKLQSPDGSFLTSPASTAFALMQTNDKNCLRYLTNVVQKNNGGAPCQYPIAIFECFWVIDRIQRLGISRYFQLEIKDCLDFLSKYWTEYGCSWDINTRICDLDDTCMAFRLLRLHGYDVSSEPFRHFEQDGEFFCFAGQTTQSVTVNFNLYRATQVMFPGEKILEEARQFSYKFLREKQAANNFRDKWAILKDLGGEVKYALEVPWYASLPRVETRFYIEQYGGDDDVWIAKTFYRLPNVNNNVNLELAKVDFNNCQALHRTEWEDLQRWFMECKLGNFGMSSESLLVPYFLAAASIFESERSTERLAWAKTAFLMETIGSHFDDQRRAFVQEFKDIISKIGQGHINERRMEPEGTKGNLISILLTTLNHLSSEALVGCDRDINPYLCGAWEKWMMMWEEEGDRYKGAAELLVNTINLSSGQFLLNDTSSHTKYERLVTVSNRVCHQLAHCLPKVHGNENHMVYSDTMNIKVDTDMQELVQLVLQNSAEDISMDAKQTFLTVARSFYYVAHCDMETINFHIAKVLFEPVD